MFIIKENKNFLIALFIVSILWYITFIIKPFNFWFNMALNTIFLTLISFAFSKEKLFKKEEFNFKVLILAIFSALILYIIFFIGKEIISILPDSSKMIKSVYNNSKETPKIIILSLLFFPIGFGEEVFWRGYLQKKVYNLYPKLIAVFIVSFIYMAVHFVTLNPVLILASLVCGLFWGFLYAYTDSLLLVALSHMIWDPLIFVVLPFYN